MKLDCCVEEAIYFRPTQKPTEISAGSCSRHPKCAAKGLTGECCPTDDNAKLSCCFDIPGSCSANPECEALGLTGECCPTDENVKLDCCFAGVLPSGSCDVYPRCRELGLKGVCCPKDGTGQKLDCCSEEPGLPILGESYCTNTPDYSCYQFGRPECCLKSTIECPKIQPGCEIGWPIVGDSYCTYAEDFSCYKNGRPRCCLDDSLYCPDERPECEIGFPIVGDSYCTQSPNFGCYRSGWPECCGDDRSSNGCPNKKPGCEIGLPEVGDSYCSDPPDFMCYEMGYPSCCLERDLTSCPNEKPQCNIGRRGCELQDSLPSLCKCNDDGFHRLVSYPQFTHLFSVSRDPNVCSFFLLIPNHHQCCKQTTNH